MRTSLRVWLFVLSLSFLALALATFLPNRQLWLLTWALVLGINVALFWLPEWILSRFKAEEILGNDPYGLLREWDRMEHPQTQLRFWQIPTDQNVLMVLGRTSKNAQVLISEKLLKSLSQEEIPVLVKALARWANSPLLYPLTLLTGLAICLPNRLNRRLQNFLMDQKEWMLLEKNLFVSSAEKTTWAHLLMRWNYQSLNSPRNLMLNKTAASLLPLHSKNMGCRIINLVSQFPPQR